MKRKLVYMRLASAGLAIWFGLIACGFLNTTRVNELKTETQSVDMESANTARVQIEFPTGELKVASGASSLMAASFRHNVAAWQPQVKYSESGAQGELVVSQPGSDQLPVGGQLINEWTIHLSNDVPINLTILTGAGNSELNLGALDLTTLNIETGAGTTNIDLDGNWDHDVTVSIIGGLGELKVNLPSQMGAQVEMDTALVTVNANGLIVADEGYVNKAYGKTSHTLTVKLTAGVGSVTLTVP